MNRINTFKILTLTAFGLCILPESAHAYIDPGSGSYFVQIVLIAFFSSIAFIKAFWGNITARVRSLFKGKG